MAKTNNQELQLTKMEFWFLLTQFSPCSILGFPNPTQGLLTKDIDKIYNDCLQQLSQRDLIRILSENELAIETSAASLFEELVHPKQTLLVTIKNKDECEVHYFDFCHHSIIHRYEESSGNYKLIVCNNQKEIVNLIIGSKRKALKKEVIRTVKIPKEEYERLAKAIENKDAAYGSSSLDQELNFDLWNPDENIALTLVQRADQNQGVREKGFGVLFANNKAWVLEMVKDSVLLSRVSTEELINILLQISK